MNGHLEKAKGALDAASDLVAGCSDGDIFDEANLEVRDKVRHLLTIADVQAQVAQADALESIAGSLGGLLSEYHLRRVPL